MRHTIPRYYFENEFKAFYDYFLIQPHKEKRFSPGNYLWAPSKPLNHVYYIQSGVVQTYVEHENGHRKILSFHGKGSIFPGFQRQNFKIENSIVTLAVTEVTALEFTKEQFLKMYQDNMPLNLQVLEWTASYINLLIYEAAHQEYNDLFLKLCNLLYLMAYNISDESKSNIVPLTQDDIADILGSNRVSVAKNLAALRKENIIATHRRWIEIINPDKLAEYCSFETLPT